MRLPSFETIAKPHNDILKGRFTADTYAARLGQVVKNEGPLEYRNAQRFFERTHETNGLTSLLNGVEGRLKGRNRQNQDPIVQLQTPFGGGKTHTLISLYHKAKEWNALPVVIVGSDMDPGHGDTFWGSIEQQLTGGLQRFKNQVAPGTERLSDMFTDMKRPVLILMDEVLNYLERAAGVAVQKSTLAEQTLAFMLSLTEAVASHKSIAFIATLQQSEVAPIEEKYSLFTDLLTRMKRVVTPVEDAEIASIIRKRLFGEVNLNEAKRIAREFAKYARQESILPPGIQESEYRKQFVESYPFQPEVIDVLYQRWGSFQNFQRTRGVLRFLSHVVQRTSGKNRPYITLADFDLTDNDIRDELLEHIGAPYRGIIDNDITGRTAGAKTTDTTLGGTYQHLALGTRTATAIFLFSFTGGMERGANLDEIKRSAAVLEHPAAIVDTAKHRLTEHLFYLRTENGISYFDTQPNLRRIVQTRIDNIDDEIVGGRTSTQLRKSFKSSGYFKTYVAPKDGTDIPDTDDVKLIVLPKRDDAFCQSLVENRGETPRIYRNTLFFIIPSAGEANQLEAAVKREIAHAEIKKDSSLNLSDAQRREINDVLKHSESTLENAVRRDYRIVLIPTKGGFSEEDIGLPASGINTPFDETVYEMLRVKGEILISIGPRNISIRYLKDNDTVPTAQLFHSSLRTPGETRVLREAWVEGIRQGVQDGHFALGEKVDGRLVPRHFKELPLEITLDNDEVIIQPHLIRESITPEDILRDYLMDCETISTSQPFQYNPQSTNKPRPLRDVWEAAIREGIQKGTFGLGDKMDNEFIPRAFRQEPPATTLSDNEVLIQASLCTGLIVEPPNPYPPDEDGSVDSPPGTPPPPSPTSKAAIGIRFTLPQGKVSNVAQYISQLQASFQKMQIELKASNGEISQDAYEELKEKFRELGIEIEEM